MSLGMQATKRRLTSVKTTKKITKAMGLIAVTKLKAWQNRLKDNKFYSEKLKDIVTNQLKTVDPQTSVFLNNLDHQPATLHLIITSNLGLCGAFNNSVYNYVDRKIAPEDSLLTIGRKGYRHYKSWTQPIQTDFLDLGGRIDYEEVQRLGRYLQNVYTEKKFSHIVIHYTKYINSLNSELTTMTLLPMGDPNKKDDGITGPFAPLIEPNKKTFVDQLIPVYLNNILFSLLMDSQVAEQSARRNAMEKATDNADELIEKLMIEYNTARQTAITQEISEIVGGANAG